MNRIGLTFLLWLLVFTPFATAQSDCAPHLIAGRLVKSVIRMVNR
jgi:hypothetical protein